MSTSLVALLNSPFRRVTRESVITSDVARQRSHQTSKTTMPIPKGISAQQARNSTGRLRNIAGWSW